MADTRADVGLEQLQQKLSAEMDRLANVWADGYGAVVPALMPIIAEHLEALRDAASPTQAPAEPRFRIPAPWDERNWNIEQMGVQADALAGLGFNLASDMLRELQRLLSTQTPAKGAPCFCPECGGDPTPQEPSR